MNTPPRAAPGRPSLEPYAPLSGTVGVSPLHRRHRRPIVQLSPTSSPSDLAGVPASERLDQLMYIISTVLRGYGAQPMQSLVYLASLKEFLRRAKELDPNCIQEEDAAYNIPNPSFKQSKHRSSSSLGGYLPNSPSPKKRDSFLKQTSLMRRGPAGPKIEPDAAEVDKLEREWWSSEVVAAWYGPRPGSRMFSERNTPRKESEREAVIRRDGSFVGLNDE